jgi:hypothetical protein
MVLTPGGRLPFTALSGWLGTLGLVCAAIYYLDLRRMVQTVAVTPGAEERGK